MTNIPDTHHSPAAAREIPPEQTHRAALTLTGHAIADNWPRQDLVDVLQMLGAAPTKSGARTTDLGQRAPLSGAAQRARARARDTT